MNDPLLPAMKSSPVPPIAGGLLVPFWIAWSVTLSLFLGLEGALIWFDPAPQQNPINWIVGARAESLLWLFLLIVSAAAVVVQRSTTRLQIDCENNPLETPLTAIEAITQGTLSGRTVAISALCVGMLGLGIAAIAGTPFRGLPPGLHDEYSYLFQAKTFLDGRTSYPVMPMKELFDQMHVLNEEVMASRYFPATGFWLAPFLQMEHPEWGWWCAQGLVVTLGYLVAIRLTSQRGALLAAVWLAVCPGLVLFSQLLLAHHPTLVGIGFFLWGYIKHRQTEKVSPLWIAGIGLAFATLARPMTAAGIALPFGVDFVIRTVVDTKRLRAWPALGVPFLIAAAGMLAYDHSITGNIWDTPYGFYTRVYTPKHVYGFNNVIRGEQAQTPRVIQDYDDWAENLTPELALDNGLKRLLASSQWTIGVIPVVFCGVLSLCRWKSLSGELRLLFLAWVSLHVAHIPYWYDGIFHFHYVFEGVPMLILFMVGSISPWYSQIPLTGKTLLKQTLWGGAIAAVALALAPGEGMWSAPYLAGVDQVVFARQKQATFQMLIRQDVKQRPAIVLVEPDPSDRHISYVVNQPPLQNDVLIGRTRFDQYSLDQIHAQWPERSIYLFETQKPRLRLLKKAKR